MMSIADESTRFLLWLNMKTGGDTMHLVEVNVSSDPDWQHISENRVITIIEHLGNRGLVNNHMAMASGTSTRITAAGVAAAERYASERDNPALRFEFAANALVQAAMDNYPTTRVDLLTFVASTRAWFYDSVLELEEVERGVTYLEESGMVSAERTAAHAVAFSLTPLGTKCGFRQPICVRTFMSEQNAPQPPVNNFYGPVNGLQTGPHSTQYNTFGYDPTQLGGFARELLEAAGTASITEEARAEIITAGEALQGELATPTPEPGRVRQLLGNARQSAIEHLPGAVVQGLLTAFNLA